MSEDYEVYETDVAIVGMAARFPGASDVARYWENLRDGVESVRLYTDEELRAAGERPELLSRKNYVRAGAPLEGMELFDGEFFGFSPKESAILDPQHRHFLECCWEALEHAGHPPERFGGPIGVFAGCGMGSYFYFNLCTNPDLVREVGMFLLRHTGNDKDFLATRASYLLDLRGPAIGVQTACSTSLVAAHLACQSLLRRECDLALAGGVTIELPHRRGYLFHEGEILSPTGHCHAFDHRAQGTVFGSGAGVVALRRLEDAIDDGDVIHAVIRGSAVNNDGSGKVNYLAPSVDGQASCMVEAYAAANVDPRTVEYVECHGTGTYLGDPIEIEALSQAFRTATDDRGFCRIGSVKTNIGHLDTAAGVASLIKAALALEHARIPPSLNFEKTNPTIALDESPFAVADRAMDWPAPKTHPRRAAVNSLGVGGTNAHVVLQEPPARAQGSEATRPAQLISLSAKSAASLDGACRKLAAHLRAHPELPLADVAWTLHHGRRAFEKRRVLAVSDREECVRLLEEGDPRRVFTHAASSKTSVVFALPGGGAHYVKMGAGLCAEPVFREHFERGLALCKSAHGIDLAPILAGNGDLARMSHQLPAIFITSYAMAQLLIEWRLEPAALIGHSLGENTAACLAGVMSFADCLGLVVLRGRSFEKAPAGAMLSVSLPPDALAPYMSSELDIAVLNAPDVTVVSGPPAAIDGLAKRLENVEGIEVRRLPIPTPAHSRLLEPILGEMRDYLRSIRLNAPQIPIVSNLTGTWLTEAQATDPEYWVRHLRSTVRFADGLATLLDHPSRTVIECGPGRALSSLARQHPSAKKGAHHALASMRHEDEDIDDVAFFTAALGRAWASGADFAWEKLWPREERVRVELPTYAWNHKPYFIEPGEVRREDELDLPKIDDIERWGWKPSWKPVPVEPNPSRERHTWLLFLDRAGVGRRIRDRLVARGDRVIAVHEGDAYHRRSEHEYVLSPERGKDGYAALLRDLVQSGAAPDRIVHAWLLGSDGASVRPGSSVFHHHQERGFFALFFLAQALTEESVPSPIHLTVLADGMQRVEGEALSYPEKATILGPVQVIPRELEGVTASAVDIELPRREGWLHKKRAERALDALVERLEAELLAPPKRAIVALRGEQRFEESFSPVSLAGGTTPIREGGVYLITGGLGGIGLTIAEHLARRYRAKLVLLSRSPIPHSKQEWLRAHGAGDRMGQRIQKLIDIEEAGADVMVATADVTNLEAMREVVAEAEQRFGAIRGVIHAAGAIDDALIATKTQSSVEDVFTPKIQGTLVLDELFRGRELDFVVLFSSTSTVSAPAGQIDYVAANAFLNAYAKHRPRAHAIQWGVWSGVGMAAAATDDPAAHAGELAGEQPRHPFLDARVRDARGETVLSATYSPATHWILDGHRTRAGQPLLVGTAYLEIARAALEAHGERAPFEIEDLFFLRALAIGDGESREVRVKLRPTERGYALEVRSRAEAGWALHAQAHVAIRAMSAGVLPLGAIEGRCLRELPRGSSEARASQAHEENGIETPQEKHLAFGPRWRVLKRGALGDGEAIGWLSLPSRFAGEVRELALHPALLDIATGWAMELIDGYHAESLWVPVSYGRVRVHAAVPAAIVSWVKTRGDARDDADFVAFDIVIADESGRVLVEIEELTLRKMKEGIDLSAAPNASEVEIERTGERELSPAERQLRANLERGISPTEGPQAFERALAMGEPQLVVSSLDLAGLVRQADSAAGSRASGVELARPDLDSEYVAPRDEIEKTLVGFWQELLGVDRVGVEDSFFDLGGHSLIAVRLFAKVKKAFEVQFPISVLFEAPTIARCAELVRAATTTTIASEPSETKPRARYAHLVAMHPGEGGPKTPFFLVAGMFGNVLNLRHLAHLLGTDRRFYGLQARGLYGEHAPHETFDEMAEAYIAEMRTVQPRGPYLLGGFSGGGIAAYEIAQKLTSSGEEVGVLVMLDTPLPFPPPRLSARDRAAIQLAELRMRGPRYLAEWAMKRSRWELAKLEQRLSYDGEPAAAPEAFHDQAIERAFRRALLRYELRAWPGRIALFRPKLEVAYDLGHGRLLDRDREYVYEDNGWTPYAGAIEVIEVPGDHDAMVLEPSVRVLAQKLRAVLASAEMRRRESPALAAE